MKNIILLSGILLGIILGLFPKIDKPKPLIWKISVILIMTLSIVLSLIPPIAANLATANFISSKKTNFPVDVFVHVDPKTLSFNKRTSTWIMDMIDIKNKNQSEELTVINIDLFKDVKVDDKLILNVIKKEGDDFYTFNSIKYSNPILVLPYVPQLEEQIRIMNFHVPMAWLSVLAFLMAMIYSIGYLRTKDFSYDRKAIASAELGTLFCILATVTGMIWAKANWGSFWNWDPRETSIFILLMIYGAYFSLRAAIDNPEVKARLGAVYSIIAFITVPFLIFILPRMLAGLHPGAQNDNNTGPVLSSDEDSLSRLQQYSFSLGFAAFTLIYFWMLNIRVRIKNLSFKLTRITYKP